MHSRDKSQIFQKRAVALCWLNLADLSCNRKKSVYAARSLPARLKISRKFSRKVRPRCGIPPGQLKSRNRTCSLMQAKQAEQMKKKESKRAIERERKMQEGWDTAVDVITYSTLWDFKGELDLFRYFGRNICSWFDVSFLPRAFTHPFRSSSALIYTPGAMGIFT